MHNGLLKQLLLVAFCHCFVASFSQENVAGKWLAEDSTRIYEVYKTNTGYDAKIYWSNRKANETGALVLRHLTYDAQKRRYSGIIYSVVDGSAKMAKIQINESTATLEITIPRLFVLPVTIKWYRKPEL